MKKKDLYNLYQEEIDDASDSETVDAKDDEEIDEEMVFNESDEERFGSYFPAKDDEEQDDDEQDDDEQDDDEQDEEQGNLSDMLKRENLQDLINAHHESDELLEDFSDSDSDGSVKDLSALVSNKRKIVDLNAKQGEFTIPLSGKVSLYDMMESVQEETSFGALKKKLKNLENTSKVNAPAATRIKNRMERIAAYEEANKKISKWTSLVKKNREADHLNFEDDKGINMTSSAMVSQFNPSTDMELEIQNLIKESGMGEKEVAENEELQLVQVSKDELMERQKELSKMRALCFFKEKKQKKIAKIKSKVYRKLHRKKKGDEIDLDLEELKKIDPQLAEERVRKLELERAKERVSLKHKNTSKWAKQILNRKDNDPETRIALMKQLEKHQQLKKRITGIDSDESDHHVDLESNENLLDHFDDLENDIDKSEPPLKGLMGMKFMQRGFERQKNEVKELIRNVKEWDDVEDDELLEEDSVEQQSNTNQKEASDISDGYMSNESGDFKEDEHIHSIQTSGPITVGNIKQLEPLFEVKPFEIKDQTQSSYFGNINTPKNTAEDSSDESSGADILDLESEHSVEESQPTIQEPGNDQIVSPISNPWLQADISEPLQKSQKGSDHLDGMARSVLKLDKHKRKLEKTKDETMIQFELEVKEHEKENGPEDAIIDDISRDVTDNDDESKSDSDLDVIHSTDINNLSRSEIMRMTFENDNVVEEFEDEKKNIIERDQPKEEDLTLPGWGSWGGMGLKPQKQKKVVKSIPGIEVEKRKDAKLKHVIINEKRLKKSIQYLVPQVPHGFENRDQYERTIRMPIGKEWNTQNVYLEKIAPRIQKKLGEAIQPIKFVSSTKKASGRRKF